MTVDLKLYEKFVEGVTSSPSNDVEALITRLQELSTQEPKLNVAALLTGGIGLASEGGEFNEIVKKMIFQGKPWNDETRYHLVRELSDICWYLATACRAINVDLNEVFEENVRKLENRYPGGKFDVHFSENRKTGDL